MFIAAANDYFREGGLNKIEMATVKGATTHCHKIPVNVPVVAEVGVGPVGIPELRHLCSYCRYTMRRGLKSLGWHFVEHMELLTEERQPYKLDQGKR